MNSSRISDRFGRPKSEFLVAFGLLIPLVALAVTSWPAPTSENTGNGPRTTRSWDETLRDPLEGGIPVSREEAERSANYRIPLPSHPDASESNLTQSFVVPNRARRAAVTFDSGILIVFYPPDVSDPGAEFAGLIANGSVPNGRIETVQGRPALAIEPDTDDLGTNAGSLQFVLDGISVTLYGQDVPVERLKEIAETIS